MRKLVSVIVPCHNRGPLLPFTLESLKGQSVSQKDYEVLVVDDGSSDSTVRVAEKHAWEQCRYFRRPHYGRAAARNHGISQARGEVLIFSDSDSIVCRDFVHNHLRHYENDSAQAVIGGKQEILTLLPWWMPAWPAAAVLRRIGRRRPSAYRRAVAMLFHGKLRRVVPMRRIAQYSSYLERNAMPYHLPEPPPDMRTTPIPWIYYVSCNASASREAIEQAGGFDENFTGWGLEDIELGFRLHKRGVRFAYDPVAVNYHQTHALSLRGLNETADRNLRYFARKHPCLEVELHADFVAGRLSLADYEARVAADRQTPVTEQIGGGS